MWWENNYARGGHGLPKVSTRPAMPDPSMPCGQATTETALCQFLGWPARKAGSLRPSSSLLDTTRRTPMIPTDQPLQRSIEVQLDPARRGGYGLAPVLGAPTLEVDSGIRRISSRTTVNIGVWRRPADGQPLHGGASRLQG
jgi:hypothetical protein